MGQVVLKGEDVREAEQAMRHRMKLALALFAHQGDRNLMLGAYGCGVFRNDPVRIAGWWKDCLLYTSPSTWPGLLRRDWPFPYRCPRCGPGGWPPPEAWSRGT